VIYMTDWVILDPLVSILVAALILIWSIKLIRSAMHILLEASPKHLSMRSAMNNACKAAGIPHYCVHQLRHTFATSLLNAGVSLITLMKLLGHKKIEMTLRYAAVTQETIRREYFEGINKAIEQYDIPDVYKSQQSQPTQSMLDIISLVEKRRQESQNPKSEKKTIQFIKRLRRAHAELSYYV